MARRGEHCGFSVLAVFLAVKYSFSKLSVSYYIGRPAHVHHFACDVEHEADASVYDAPIASIKNVLRKR